MKKSQIIFGLFKLLAPLLHIMIITILLGVMGYILAAAVTVSGAMIVLERLQLYEASAAVLILIMFISAVSRGSARYIEQKSGHYIAFKELAMIRDKVFLALRRLAPAKLSERGQGDLCSIVTSDIEQLEVFYAHTVAPVMIALITSLISAAFICSYSIYGGLTALIFYIVIGVVIPVSTAKIGNNSAKEARKELADINDYFLESLRGIEISVQYNNIQNRHERILKKTKAICDKQKKIKYHEGIASALTGTLVVCGIIICFAVSYISSGELGEALVSAVALSATYGPVIALSNLSATLTQTFASGERVLKLLVEEPCVNEIENGRVPEFNNIEVRDVSFGYNGTKVLDNVNLKAEKNEIIGIVGASGCGKSTLLKLMMRFWECDEGNIYISDTDINSINSDHLKRLEGFMTQSTDLFRGTIIDNIKIGNKYADEAAVTDACKKASIHDFIMTLPNGYKTEVGELGDKLSAGEKQRIGLARAFLHDSALLLLDEPTANLDAMNEGIILKSISLEKERTVIISSHRKSTTSICDIVYGFSKTVI